MKLGNEFKRILTAALTAAMVFTSIPAVPVMAASADVLTEDAAIHDSLFAEGSEGISESMGLPAGDLADLSEEALSAEEEIASPDGIEITDSEAIDSEVTEELAEDNSEAVAGPEGEVSEGDPGDKWLTLHIDNSDLILDKVTYTYPGGGGDETVDMSGIRSRDVTVFDKGNDINIKDVTFKDGMGVDNRYELSISGNSTSPTPGTAVKAADITTEIYNKVFNKSYGITDIYFKAARTVYDGSFTLDVVSGNGILQGVTYTIVSIDSTGNTNVSTTAEVKYPDWNKPISYTNAKSISVKMSSFDTDIANDAVLNNIAELKVNNVKRTAEYRSTEEIIELKDTSFKGTIPVKVDVKPEYKCGTLHIDVLSRNSVRENDKTDKIISINKIGYRFDGYNIGGETAKYDVVVDSDNGIDIPFRFATDVQLAVEDDEGYSNNKYEYTFGTADNQKKKSVLSDTIELTDGATTTIAIRPKQVTFDSTLTIKSTSDNCIDSFIYQFYSDKEGAVPITGAGGEVKINQSGENTKELTYNGAASVRLDGFKLGTENIDLNKAALRLDGKLATGGPSDETGLFELGAIGRTVEVKAIAKKKVTVSFDSAGNFYDNTNNPSTKATYSISGEEIKETGNPNGKATWDSVGKKAWEIYVEPGYTLSVNVIYPESKKYYFPEAKINGKKIKVDRNSDATKEWWTIGKIEQDTVVDIESKYFLAGGDNTKINVTLEGDTTPGIQGLTFTGPVANIPAISTDNVFSYSGPVWLKATVTVSTDAAAYYDITEAEYRDYNGRNTRIDKTYSYSEGYINGVDNIYNSYRAPYDIYKGFEILIPVIAVRAALMDEGSLVIAATQEKKDICYNVAVNTDQGIKNVSITHEGEEVLAADGSTVISIFNYFSSDPEKHYVKYGDSVGFDIELKPGYKLKNAEIRDIIDSELIVSENRLKFDVKTRKGATAVITTEETYVESVKYKNGDEVTLGKKGYEVIYNKPVSLALIKGSGTKVSMNLIAKIGGKDVTSDLIAAGVLKEVISGGKIESYDFNGNNELTQGKTIVITMFPGGTSASDSNAKTVTLIVDKSNKSIKFKNATETMPLGATAKFTAAVTGNIETKITVNGAAQSGREFDETGVEIELSDDNKTLTVESEAKLLAPKDYKIEIIDKNSTEKIAEITVKITLDAIKAATPTGKISNTTNNTIVLGNLSTGKLDKDIDGLYYHIKAARTDSNGGDLLKDSVEAYVPVKSGSSYTSTYTIELLKDAYKSDEAKKLAGIPGAAYAVTVKLVQRNGGTNLTGAESKELTLSTEMKEGGVFETKLKLKKAGKGNAYSNLSNVDALTYRESYYHCYLTGKPYQIEPVYSKNTSIRRLDRVELWYADGAKPIETVVSGNLIVEDSMIYFAPCTAGNMLAAGNYVIKAYALEATGVDVVATMKVKVLQAIEAIEIRDVPSKIVKLPGKKATATLTAFDVTYIPAKDEQVNKKTNKVKWELVDAADDAKAFTYPGVSIKSNGKITIDKNVQVKKDITFRVKATAKDYEGNYTYKISGKIVLTSHNPELKMEYTPAISYNYKELKDGASLDLYEAFDISTGSDYAYQELIRIYDVDNTGTPNTVPADVRVSGAKLIYNENGVASIGLTKPGKIKITAKALDGSERTCVRTLTVNYPADEALAFYLQGDSNLSNVDNMNNKVLDATTFSFDNYRASGSSLALDVYGYNYIKGVDRRSFIDHKISVKGGKLVKPYKGAQYRYQLIPTTEKTVVKIKDNTKKNGKEVTININNKAIGSSKLTGVKVTAQNIFNGKDSKGKILSYIDYSDSKNYASVSPNMVKYTLAASGRMGTLSADHVLIKIIKDDTKVGTDKLREALITNNAGTANPRNTISYTGYGDYAAPLNSTDNSFYINWSTASDYAESKFNISKGSYKIMLTPVKKVTVKIDGSDEIRYEATAKPVNVTVAAVNAPKASVKPLATLDFTKTANKADLDNGKRKDKNVVAGSVELGVPKGTDPQLKDSNIKGNLNHFSRYFKLSTDKKQLEFQGSAAYIDVSGKSVAAVDKLDPKTDKNELQGYIAYKYQTFDGIVHYEYYKVNLKAAAAGITK